MTHTHRFLSEMSAPERELALAVHERERCETKLANTIERVKLLNLGTSRDLLAAEFGEWQRAHARCAKLARKVADAGRAA